MFRYMRCLRCARGCVLSPDFADAWSCDDSLLPVGVVTTICPLAVDVSLATTQCMIATYLLNSRQTIRRTSHVASTTRHPLSSCSCITHHPWSYQHVNGDNLVFERVHECRPCIRFGIMPSDIHTSPILLSTYLSNYNMHIIFMPRFRSNYCRIRRLFRF